MGDVELADRIAAIDILASAFRDDSQFSGLMDLVSMILGSGGPPRPQQPLRNGHKATA